MQRRSEPKAKQESAPFLGAGYWGQGFSADKSDKNDFVSILTVYMVYSKLT